LSGSKESVPVVVTIDGPAGAGKSTVAKLLASSLGFDFLDTGAMYRCVTFAALQQGVALDDPQAIFELAKGLSIELDGSNVRLNGRDISDAIRTPEVGQSIAAIADNVLVRQLLSQWQRDWAKGRCVVTEGRDQGSEVFQDSPCKIFLVASSEERAKRRRDELAQKGINIDWQSILDQQNRRDEQDRSRSVGSLRKASDAIEFSTDGLTLAEVLGKLEGIVRAHLRRAARATPPGSHQPQSSSRQTLPSRDSE
jgi:CMP/dCMP kinase